MSILDPSSNHLVPVSQAINRAQILKQLSISEPAMVEPVPSSASRFVSNSLVAAAAFIVGTGGLFTADYIVARNDRGYRFQEFAFRGVELPAIPRQLVRSPTENLARVRQILRPTTIELASLIGVSRQAIYNWQAGQVIAPHNEARIEELAKAADLLVASGLSGENRPLARMIPGGKTVFEAIRDGSPPEDTVKKLISMLDREVLQRNSLSRRLAGRMRKPIDTSEIGSPYLDESA